MMSVGKSIPTCALPPSLLWHRLVNRSISSWNGPLHKSADQRSNEKISLQSFDCLESFLHGASKGVMFWFFQRREAFLAQEKMGKWEEDKLEEYVLLPATLGSVSRRDCMFLSHYWVSRDHPDPYSQALRLNQDELRGQDWLYIWVDWTCTPQAPRTSAEASYFARTLATVSSIIRNAGFSYFYPPWERRLWILYELAEYLLTSSDKLTTPDVQTFVNHISEMVEHGVHYVLRKYNYVCPYGNDEAFLIPRLELLVLLQQLQVDIDDRRQLLDNITWFRSSKVLFVSNGNKGSLKLERFSGSLIYKGEEYEFTPFLVDAIQDDT